MKQTRMPFHPLRLLLAALCWLLAQGGMAADLPAADPPQSFRVLCYHDVRDNLRQSFQTWPEPTAIDTRDLIEQFTWLQQNGWQPVSLQQIVDARAGRGRLPEKAVLLTFDDGYKSVYTKVFPLLKLFNYPAVIAVVGDWIGTPAGTPVQYGDARLARHHFVDWEEVREMTASGLVEVASHSHGMHQGIQANPQGNQIPSAIARLYRPNGNAYETDADYAARIRADLKRSADLIERHAGKRPRAMVWPYGAYNQPAVGWAAEAGMTITMNLEPGPNTPQDSLSRMRRALVTYSNGVPDLARMLQQPATYDGQLQPLERVVHVDLDYVYDPDPEKQEANLSALLDRMVRLRPTTVYLQAYADPDGDGVADALYFPNRHLPLRADLFSRVAWQLKTRSQVKVYAWMPVMAFKLPAGHAAADRLVRVMPGAPEAAGRGRYHRLSPFDPLARKTVTEIYQDLGKHAVFGGVLFHDDATLSDYEDASPAALAQYEQWGLPGSVQAIRADASARRRWTEKKSAHIDAFTLSLAAVLREYQPALLTARNLYAQPVLNPEAEEWFAQNFTAALAAYDFVAVMAMPYMEGETDPDRWLQQLVARVKSVPGALRKTVFELQSRDWKTGEPIAAATLAAQWRRLNLQGARHWGYYPDDFHRNQPDAATIKPVISVETHPVQR